MAVENDNSSSMSDKDRDMTRRFGGEARDEQIEKKDTDDDSDDEKESSKDSKKSEDKRPPKRALFLRSEGEDGKQEKHTQTTVEKQRKGLLGLLREEEQLESESPTEDTVLSPKEIEPTSGEEATREEFQDVVIERLAEVESELEQPQVKNPQEVLADANYLEDVGERLEEGLPPEQAIEDAYEDQLTPPEADAEPADLEDSSNFEEDEVVNLNQNTQANQQNPNIVTPQPQTPNRAPVPPVVPLVVRGGRGGGAGSPPIGGGVPPFVPFGPGNPNVGNTPPQNPNNLMNNPNMVAMNEFYYRKKKSRDLLVGGIVGYMIGRRGGRKRTEARLEPEIRKRDEAIGELKNKLYNTEDRVRELAREKSAVETVVEPDKSRKDKIAEPIVLPGTETVRTEIVEVPRVETVVERIEHIKTDTIEVERKAMEEAEKAFEATLEEKAVEVISAEPELVEQVLERNPVIEQLVATKGAKEVEKQTTEALKKTKEAQRISAFETRKDPRSMTVPELLEIAEHIHLEKTSLKELYEHNRIDAVNMRRVVLEYLNGGNRYEKVLRGSLEAVEMQRELRHEMKQGDASFSQSGGSGGDSSNQNASAMSGQASEPTSSHDEPNALLDAASKAIKDEQDERLMISNGTAVVLGILMGVAIMIVLLLYSDVL